MKLQMDSLKDKGLVCEMQLLLRSDRSSWSRPQTHLCLQVYLNWLSSTLISCSQNQQNGQGKKKSSYSLHRFKVQKGRNIYLFGRKFWKPACRQRNNVKKKRKKKKILSKKKRFHFSLVTLVKWKKNNEVQITLQRNAELLQTLTIKNAISFFSRVSLLFS